MTRIDHATVARTILSNIEPVEMTNPETGNWLAKAQVSALLALVEQQRIANLIAWTTRDGQTPIAEVRNIIAEGLGL